jgi:hypothetical protein
LLRTLGAEILRIGILEVGLRLYGSGLEIIVTRGAATGEQQGKRHDAKQKPTHECPVVMMDLPHSLTFEYTRPAEGITLFSNINVKNWLFTSEL